MLHCDDKHQHHSYCWSINFLHKMNNAIIATQMKLSVMDKLQQKIFSSEIKIKCSVHQTLHLIRCCKGKSGSGKSKDKLPKIRVSQTFWDLNPL